MNRTTDPIPPPDSERVFAYFLGELTAAESEQFEAQVFQDEDLAEQVFALEDELIELYLQQGLSTARRARFEQHYLTTAVRHERVELAAAFERQLAAPPMARVAEVPRQTTAWWQTLFLTPRLAWALLLLCVLSAGLWWLWRNRAPAPDQFAHRASPTPQLTRSPTPALLLPSVTPTAPPRVVPSPRPALLATITLAPGLPRGGGQALPTLQLPTAATAAELTLQLVSADSQSYRAVLQTEGVTVLTTRGLKARAAATGVTEVRVRIPARRLKRADYLLLLFGESQGGQSASSPVAGYSFRAIFK
ncbi:MAG: hypothetical protein HYR56_20455 [Acidobacteria bacterium]|nr:hypothetical protein [Acidobacteriota bacterium]MBI3423277.1 hypothetical protein [Acidobacteriota bacterium]